MVLSRAGAHGARLGHGAAHPRAGRGAAMDNFLAEVSAGRWALPPLLLFLLLVLLLSCCGVALWDRSRHPGGGGGVPAVPRGGQGAPWGHGGPSFRAPREGVPGTGELCRRKTPGKEDLEGDGACSLPRGSRRLRCARRGEHTKDALLLARGKRRKWKLGSSAALKQLNFARRCFNESLQPAQRQRSLANKRCSPLLRPLLHARSLRLDCDFQ